jgi:hypothetical protein
MGNETDQAAIRYSSDYFVFLADDGGEPLVIPMDFNWRPSESGVHLEFKAWYGTRASWPIAYRSQEHSLTNSTLPGEIWELPAIGEFSFEGEQRTIVITMAHAPELRLKVPDLTEWATAESGDDARDNNLFAVRGDALVAGSLRNGWIIYERIRRRGSPLGGGHNFRRFHWIPLVIDGVFYHFRDHSGEHSAMRWIQKGDRLIAEQGSDFVFTVLTTSVDAKSQRQDVPQELQIVADAWQVDITLTSSGHQTGHGPLVGKGLALYRQSLLESTAASKQVGYGMLELILED